MNTHPTSAATQAVADRLCELCNTGQHRQAIVELYADNARHVEAMAFPGSPYKLITSGKPDLLTSADHWAANTIVHSASVSKPMVNGDQFLVEMKLDCTSKDGPMAGQRMAMSEQCLYTVKDGKITEARFFYGGC